MCINSPLKTFQASITIGQNSNTINTLNTYKINHTISFYVSKQCSHSFKCTVCMFYNIMKILMAGLQQTSTDNNLNLTKL